MANLGTLLDGVTHVFHLAAQAGVRKSWGRDFRTYTEHNVDASQRLLEACVGRPIQKFVYASSSSLYGDAKTIPVAEDALPRPLSPYGVTKLAAEHLCQLYWANHLVPTTSVRYFTRMLTVSIAVFSSMCSMLSSSKVRAQSSVSDTDGAFLSSSWRMDRTTRAT